MRKIDRSKYREFMDPAKKCAADRVYPMSIAAGIQDGEIYTDDRGCLLFRHYCGFAYISGTVSPDVLEEIYQKFFVPETDRRFLLITDSDLVSDFYSDRELVRLDQRIEYVHSGMPEKAPVLAAGFDLERITAGNYADIHGRIIPSFSWKSRDSFFENGFGFLARSREDGCFAAVAFSSGVSQEEVDIGVETAELYRHNGLASFLAYKMCGEIIKQGKKPVWAHAKNNTGSGRTAVSAGFRPFRVNTVIRKIQL